MCAIHSRECFLSKNCLLVFDKSNPRNMRNYDRTGGGFLAWIYGILANYFIPPFIILPILLLAYENIR